LWVLAEVFRDFPQSPGECQLNALKQTVLTIWYHNTKLQSVNPTSELVFTFQMMMDKSVQVK